MLGRLDFGCLVMQFHPTLTLRYLEKNKTISSGFSGYNNISKLCLYFCYGESSAQASDLSKGWGYSLRMGIEREEIEGRDSLSTLVILKEV